MEKQRIELPLYTLELTTVDRVIEHGPCRLCSVCISGDGAAGDCDVYDGESTADQKKVHLEVLSGTTFNFEPACGVFFRKGIYVVRNASTTNVMITYKPLTDKEAAELLG